MVPVNKEKILFEPTEFKFENRDAFNPASIEVNGNMHLFYRAASIGNYSSIGYCELKSPGVLQN